MNISKCFQVMGTFVLLWGFALGAQAVLVEPNWDQASAMALAQSEDTSAVRHGLMDLTIAGSTTEVLDLLEDTLHRPDWAVPVREYTVFAYTQELRSLPSSVVSSAILTYLKSYQARTLVPHEEHDWTGVPLFNIRGAASGVENAWLRQDAMLEGLALLKSKPRALVDIFLIETHPAARQGYLAVLEQASRAQLMSLSKASLRRLASNPELTPLAGQSALLAGNLQALEMVFVQGSGPFMAHLMREAAQRLSAIDSGALLGATLAQANAENAALAIAELAPTAATLQGTQDLLMGQLGHPRLGSAVALALSSRLTPTSRVTLETLAESDDALLASRARMALGRPVNERQE